MTVKFKSDNIEKYRVLADGIKDSLVVSEATITEKEPHSAYYNNLPEGIGKKEIEELSKYNSKFMTAAHIAVGELAADVFKSKKSVTSVAAEIGYFANSDSININVSRSKTYQNHLAKPGEDKEVTKQLVMQTTVNSQFNNGYGLKAVRASMSEEFAEMFKK